jgi:hypothetical protein
VLDGIVPFLIRKYYLFLTVDLWGLDMNKHLVMAVALSTSLFVGPVYAAPGENWEIVTTTDMPGMPVSLGESTVTVCMPKGAEKDPKQLMSQAGDCQVSDLKTVGSKTNWKMRCDRGGEVMTGNGEVTYSSDSFKGVSRLSGTSEGRTAQMTANYLGKRIGTPCDTSAAPVAAIKGMESINELMGMANKQMASAIAEQCEVSNYRAAELVSNRFFGPTAACPGKEKFACKVISKNVTKNPDVYVKLAKHDDTSDISITKACEIDMEATTRLICKLVDSSNFEELAEYCPSEAKAYKVERSSAVSPGTGSGSGDSTVTTVIDGARKLKGLFGF